MTETTGEPAKTLHRLLQIKKINETNYINEEIDIEPIDADVIIVDEVSMIDLSLMKYLLTAVYEGTKLVLVGDVDQLPSVGARKCTKMHNTIRKNNSNRTRQNLQTSSKIKNNIKCT